MAILDSIVTGLFGLGSNAAQMTYNAIEADKNRQFNAEQAQINRDWQEVQTQDARKWQEDFYNQYQSPSAMVEQYQSAGINPALMYSKGSTGAGSVPSASVPAGNAATGSAASVGNLGNVMNDIINVANGINSIKNAKAITAAQVENLNADTEKKKEETEGQKISNFYNPQLFEQNLEKGEVEIGNGKAQIQKVLQEIDNLVKQGELTEAQVKESNVRQVLIAAQESLTKIQTSKEATLEYSISLDNWKKEWETSYIHNNGFAPGEPVWNTATTLLGSAMWKLNERRTNAKEFIKNLVLKGFNKIKETKLKYDSEDRTD